MCREKSGRNSKKFVERNYIYSSYTTTISQNRKRLEILVEFKVLTFHYVTSLIQNPASVIKNEILHENEKETSFFFIKLLFYQRDLFSIFINSLLR